MKLFIILLSFGCIASSFSPLLNDSWESFKKVHKKTYPTFENEIERRLIWEKNLEFIKQHNSLAELGKKSFTVKMNQFGDLTNSEFSKIYKSFKKSQVFIRERKIYNRSKTFIPDEVDWRTKGYVTPVKSQGSCPASWAFSAVTALEGQQFKKSGKLVPLSVQNLIDCSSDFGNFGCGNGLMDQAFKYVIANKGIDTEESYPYKGSEGECNYNPSSIGAIATDYVDIKSGSEEEFTEAIATIGPLSIAIDASQISFQFYSSGIYSDENCSSMNLDHALAVVGYGSLGSNKDYYIVKNSWGIEWGNEGYILIARNQKNMCGIATMASYPIV